MYNGGIMALSPKFEERYKNLNAQQKKAVDTIEGPLMVVAGPGSGKTEILSLRVANILSKTDVRPSNILCLTFTDLASINMRKRLVPLLGVDAYRVAIHTFHSFCVETIDRFPEYFYQGATFVAADELVQIQMLEEIFNNLPYDNPLKTVRPEEGFVYLKDVKFSIGNLKKAGITPAEFAQILDHNEETFALINPLFDEVFAPRVSKEIISKVEELVVKLKEKNVKQLQKKPFPVKHLQSFLQSTIDSLELLLERAGDAEKPTSLFSEWKADHLEKSSAGDTEGKMIFKETNRIEKMRALATVYTSYKELMWNRGYYDFDDMILDVMSALEKNETLRYQIQEQFQYVLVDEFQDTNDGQMRLLRSITDAPVNEGRPNIMVVGDDDQAIYKFQGAEISNILNFSKLYKDPTLVTMAQNYRSTQTILDLAQHVIRKGSQRLETILPNMEKTLTAHNKKLSEGKIIHKKLSSREEEYHFVAQEIKRLIDSGIEPSDIAVISRKHELLESIVPHLHKAGVPIRYERQQDVLHEPHIHQIIQIARFASSYARKDVQEADDLLPEILSYPFWGLQRIDIWNVSVSAKSDGGLWLSVMQKSENPRVREVAEFLLDLSIRSLSEPLEYIVDRIIGAHIKTLDTADGIEDADEGAGDPFGRLDEETVLHSPFKKFYFSKERFDKQKGKYLTFLSSLRVFMYALREYKKGEILSINDLVSYVDTHEKNGLLVTDNSPYVSALSAVSLLSAHKAKGLEFTAVFVLACQDSVWMSRGHGSKLPMPINLPIAPAGDGFDDKLRLFFVALTRAKELLYITASTSGDDGGDELALQFIADVTPEMFSSDTDDVSMSVPNITDILTDSWRTYHRPPTTIDESVLLSTLVENYQMSVTHLNNFLDITNGGPQNFLETNLLRFPQAKTAYGAYGTAIHSAIERLYYELRGEGKVPTLEKVLEYFKEALRKERLGVREYSEQEERGVKSLTAFYKAKKDTFKSDHKIEVNFKAQGVVVEDAYLTGKIDKIEQLEDGEWCVHDFKTGGVVYDWKGSTPYEKVKLYKFKQQIIFYKLLVENARDYAGKNTVHRGVIEFVEPDVAGHNIDLPITIDAADVERTKKLIAIVYKKIISLDFPDITKYHPTVKGIVEFEDDLLSGKI